MSGTADRRLWFTADRTELVDDGDPRAAFLAAADGDPIPDVESPDSDDAPGGLSITKEAKAENKAVEEPEADKADEADGHVCDECGKTAKTAAGLAAHKRRHED